MTDSSSIDTNVGSKFKSANIYMSLSTLDNFCIYLKV